MSSPDHLHEQAANWHHGWRAWMVAFLLALPALLPYLAHYFAGPAGQVPTGYIWYDHAYYAANAREHFDEGFHWVISNPSSPDYDSPRLFCFPQNIVIGSLIALGLAPGLAMILFGFVSGVVMVRIALGLFVLLFSDRFPSLGKGFLCFVWGSGLFTVAGLIWIAALRLKGKEAGWEWLFVCDPADGWWFLNLGRNLVFALEAYYHAFFLGTIYALLRGKFALALALLGVAAWSHPFTGLTLAAVCVSWATVEVFFIRGRVVPGWCLARRGRDSGLLPCLFEPLRGAPRCRKPMEAGVDL